MSQSQVTAKNASLAIVNQDGVTNRIEGVGPLLLHSGHLFEETDVLQRQSQQIAYIQEIRNLVVLELLASRRTDRDDPERSILARQSQGNDVDDAALCHSLAYPRVLFIFQTQEFAVFVQDLLRPRCFCGKCSELFQILLLKAHRSVHHELGLVSFTFEQPHQPMRGSQALHKMSEDPVQDFLDGQRLRTCSRQQSESAQFLV